MEREHEKLRALNVEIGERETLGDKSFFGELLAPAFAMRRAPGAVVDRDRFIKDVKQSAPRQTDVESITPFEANRALVVCVVARGVGESAERFHNVRLFTRESPEADWKLLAWANEPIE